VSLFIDPFPNLILVDLEGIGYMTDQVTNYQRIVLIGPILWWPEMANDALALRLLKHYDDWLFDSHSSLEM